MKGTLVTIFALLSVSTISSHGASGTGEDETWGSSTAGSGIDLKEPSELPSDKPSTKPRGLRGQLNAKSLKNQSDATTYGFGVLSNETAGTIDAGETEGKTDNRLSTIDSLRNEIINLKNQKGAVLKKYRSKGYPLLALRTQGNTKNLSSDALSLRKKYLTLKKEISKLKTELGHLRAIEK